MKKCNLLFLLAIVCLQSISAYAEDTDTIASESAKYKLFSPLTYSPSVIDNVFDFNKPANGFANNSDDAADLALLNIYLNRPDLVQVTEDDLEDATDVAVNVRKPVENKPEIKEEKIDVLDDIVTVGPTNIVVEKPNFWKIKGDYNLQFLQNYVSGNWYKGGENHVSMLGMFNLEANYNNKQKLTFNNKLETKLGFQTSPSDQYHHFKTNADLLNGSWGVMDVKGKKTDNILTFEPQIIEGQPQLFYRVDTIRKIQKK